LHVAWTMYADQFGTSCLPGHMSEAVQDYWKLKYRAKAKVEGQTSDKLPRVSTSTYPWRLMPYMDYSWDVMMDYWPPEGDAGFEVTATPRALIDGVAAPHLVQDLAAAPAGTAGQAVALQPAYGYNAYYIGGVWKMPATVGQPPQLVFGDAKPTATVATAMNISATATLSVVMRKVGGARFPDQLTLFCPSAYMGPSQTEMGETLLRPDSPGAAYVVPPNLGERPIWKSGAAGDEGVFVLENQAVPVMRTNALMPTATVDGSVRAATYGELRNMRNWIDMGSIPDSVQFEPMHTGQP
ncbi:MAG: hypothetical protein ACKPEA_13680, partial [Planctomycetota bacterium]